MSRMPITMLNGLGCIDCGGSCTSALKMYGTEFIGYRSLGAVSDYDQITIGGKTYTVNQIIGKTVVAAKDTKVYSGNRGTPAVVATIKAGQPIGTVQSYARPDQTGGKSWLMFESGYNKVYWAPNEAVSSEGLKDQGTKTVKEEIKEEQAKKEREEDPFGYYLKKYGLPALLIVGAIVVAGGIAKEAVKGAINKKSEATS